MIKRIRRGCYDKYRRCPGWVGGGFRYPRKTVCENGSLGNVAGGTLDYDDPLWKWKFHLCSERCGTLVLPYAERWFNPAWHLSNIRWWFKRRKY